MSRRTILGIVLAVFILLSADTLLPDRAHSAPGPLSPCLILAIAVHQAWEAYASCADNVVVFALGGCSGHYDVYLMRVADWNLSGCAPAQD